MFMYKIKAIITTNNETIQENTIGSFINGIISYKESDDTCVYLDITKNELIRENDSLKMHYIFNKDKNSRGTILVKEFGRPLDLIIKTTKVLRREKNIEIEFLVEGQIFNYKIEVK